MSGRDPPIVVAPVSVDAVTPEVVSEFVAAFRLELASLLPTFLAPLVEELKDLKNHGGFEKGNDKKCAPWPSAAVSGPPPLPPSDQALRSLSRTLPSANYLAGVDDTSTAASRISAGSLATRKLSAPTDQSLPMKMEIEMSKPLVDPQRAPVEAGDPIRWVSAAWRQLSGRRSSSAREGYHLTPRVEVVEPENYRFSLQENVENLRQSNGMTYHQKLKIAHMEMLGDRHHQQSWCVKSVTAFLDDPESSRAAHYFSQFMFAFSILSIFVGLLPYVGLMIPLFFETVIDSVLCLEVFLRAVFCPDFIVFLSNQSNIIDSLSALPLAVILSMHYGLGEEYGNNFLLSAVPVIRFLRFVRRFPKMQILITAFTDCLEALPVLMYTLAVMGVIFSAAIYLAEPRDNVTSLSDSAWLVITTISTVGYGDITPRTKLGAALSSVLMVVSQLYMAMPFGIIGYNFTAIWEKRQQIMLLNGTRDRLAKWGFGAYEIPRLFELFDLDDSAEFDMQEFKLLFKEMDIGFTEEHVVELFKLIDKDSGGSIDEKEFVKIVYPDEYRYMYSKKRGSKFERGGSAKFDKTRSSQ